MMTVGHAVHTGLHCLSCYIWYSERDWVTGLTVPNVTVLSSSAIVLFLALFLRIFEILQQYLLRLIDAYNFAFDVDSKYLLADTVWLYNN